MSSEKVITATELEDFDVVDVVEVLVAPGDKIEANQSLVTLESDKAMMEFPSPDAGTIKSIAVTVGDKVKQGDALLTLTVEQLKNETVEAVPSQEHVDNKQPDKNEPQTKDNSNQQKKYSPSNETAVIENDKAYASPAVRKYANELGVNLDEVVGSAKQGRVLKSDVQQHVQKHISSPSAHISKSENVLPDFSQFGEIEEKSFNKLKQVSAQHLHHAWTMSPHVTQFEDVDITELEKARKQLKQPAVDQGVKLTLLPFIMKALVKCLQEYPDFNSSLNKDVSALIHKKYYNIGIAVDTERGLVVPVINEVDKKKLLVLAKELMNISSLARDNKLTPKHMQGGCMTITNLGGFGGQHFTPIINYPEVAILGISRSRKVLVKNEENIEERLMLPLSLSYDHRAIDGVAAVKFITSLKSRLSDVWSLMI